jgi:Big-like domain-containing protein
MQMNRTVLGPGPCKTTGASIAVALLALTLIGCGGGSAPPPPPTPDFTLSISPSSVETDVGTTTAPVVISVTGQTGFTGSVTVSVQGLPPGITVSPSSSFLLAAGASQPLTFFVPDTTPVGGTAITVLASGASHSHSAQLALTADAIVRTYQVGSVLYLESGNAADVARIGLETAWGGSIVEVSLNGTEFVNRHDTGREVQVSYRDGNIIQWNPTLGGDDFNQGTPTIAYDLTSSSLSTKAQPLQWYAQSFGGTLGQPVFGDVLVEQTVTAVTNQPHTFKVHYKATHLANDLHPDAAQEFPAVYTNGNYNRFVYYGGVSPWANGAVSVTQFPNLPAFSPELYVPEHWGALVDTQNLGLTVFVPSQYPYVLGFASLSPGGSGPTDDWTNYFAPFVTFDIGPNFVFQGDIYLIAGDYTAARQIIYQMHQNLPSADILPPTGSTDTPSSGATVSGLISVSGWALDNVSVSKVEVLVDRSVDGVATYGSPRPDVAGTFPHAPPNIGFSYSLDTTKYPDGQHTINVRTTDNSGNAAVFGDVVINIAN